MSLLCRILGYLLSVVPAALAVLEHFPLWTATAGGRLSLLSLALLTVAVLPFWRFIKERLRSPSAWMIWLILLVLLCAFRSIIDGLITVAAVALPASLLGALCFAAARRLEERSLS